MQIHIGTSGWHYAGWREKFYPRGVKTADWLEYYARYFDCVELNSSFYRFPGSNTVEGWLAKTPSNFIFALKASRYITHQKKLRDCREALQRFLNQAEAFADKLGPVLFQLPPRWRANPQRLAEFLELLPSGLRYAMEFRDHSWHCPEVWDLLAEHGVAWCQYELEGFLAPERLTTDMVYLRLHGPGENAYRGSYDEAVLRAWAARLKRWSQGGYQVWVFFDNDQAGSAVANALRLCQLCAEAGLDCAGCADGGANL